MTTHEKTGFGAVGHAIGSRTTLHRPGYTGRAVDMKRHRKTSAHGIPAFETLTIDRTDPNVTVKTHHVEEQQDDATWKIVHDERKTSPAKRRPTN
jgi:hypothetical protein